MKISSSERPSAAPRRACWKAWQACGTSVSIIARNREDYHLPAPDRPRRILWIINHRTLLHSEVPALEALGCEVYVPHRAPDTADFRSAVTGESRAGQLTLPASAHALLNTFDFFHEPWSKSIAQIVEEHFDAVVVAFSIYLRPFFETAKHFSGPVFLRAFGREEPFRYGDYFQDPSLAGLRQTIVELGDRFTFLNAYDSILRGEDPLLQSRSHRVVAPLPDHKLPGRDSWRGGGEFALFHCGSILENYYYYRQYQSIVKNFKNIPRKIFGPQNAGVKDGSVLPWLSEGELAGLFSECSVFCYTSRERRHLHFSPIEAISIGSPVVYYKDCLLGGLIGADDQGACADEQEMSGKLRRLLKGDYDLAKVIVARQKAVLDQFSASAAVRDWSALFGKLGWAHSVSAKSEID